MQKKIIELLVQTVWSGLKSVFSAYRQVTKGIFWDFYS